MTTQSPDLEQAEPKTDPTEPSPERVKVRRPGFKKDPSPIPSPFDPSPAAATDSGDADGPSFPEPSDELPDEQPTASGSSRTSSRADKRALQKAVGVGFAGATTGAHELLVRDPHAKVVGFLLADEQDIAAVSGPGGSLLARRMGDVPLGGDLGDVVELIVAAAGYVLKQFSKLRLARQLRDSGAVLDGLQPDLTLPVDPTAYDLEVPE